MSYTIDDIRIKKFACFQKCNSAFGKLTLVGCIRADLVTDTAFNLTFDTIFKVNQRTNLHCKLIYNKGKDTWYIESLDDNPDINFKLILCTDNIAKVLDINDTFTYFVNEEYHGFRVLKQFPKYQRIIVEEQSTKKRFNLSTILKQFNTKNIVSVKKQEKGA